MRKHPILIFVVLVFVVLCIVVVAFIVPRKANNAVVKTPVSTLQATEPEEGEIIADSTEAMLPAISVYETVPVEGSPAPMQIFELPAGTYVFAPCKELPELGNTGPTEVTTYIADPDEIVYDPSTAETIPLREGSSVPGTATIPAEVMVEFDFGKYKQEVVISENSEYQVSAGQSLELQIKKNFFTWSPFNPAMQIGFCNMDTMKCYVYETLPGTHLECYQETYVYPDLPEGNYRFCIRNLYPRPLEAGYIRFGVYVK